MNVWVEAEAGVANVILDNPAQLNAPNAKMKHQHIEVFQGFTKDDTVRAVVLTGADGPAYFLH